MELVVYSNSRPFERHLAGILEDDYDLRPSFQGRSVATRQVCLLHMPSMKRGGFDWLTQQSPGRAVAVCSDIPDIGEMLESVRHGARGYCNSHMAAAHYQQMLRMLDEGQSWFPPRMLDETFRLAQNAVRSTPPEALLDGLTKREREIALAVSDGKSNREVAELHAISEVTVKTHLTNIYKKLDVRDRVSLLMLLKQA